MTWLFSPALDTATNASNNSPGVADVDPSKTMFCGNQLLSGSTISPPTTTCTLRCRNRCKITGAVKPTNAEGLRKQCSATATTSKEEPPANAGAGGRAEGALFEALLSSRGGGGTAGPAFGGSVPARRREPGGLAALAALRGALSRLGASRLPSPSPFPWLKPIPGPVGLA